MKLHPVQSLLWMLLGASTLLGCIATEGEDEGETAIAQEAAITSNAITSNAITSNAITSNAITSNAITSNALTENAITSNAITSNALTDPNARELLQYIVGCALPSGVKFDITVDDTKYKFEGQLGLAPEWGVEGGSCGATCRGWVSSCVIARVDYLGQPMPISVRGATPALAVSSSEANAYTLREGAYYGDIFASPQQFFGCIPPGATGLTRVCGPSLDGCFLQVPGYCTSVCDGIQSNGAYLNCHDHARGANGLYPAGTQLFAQPVTVFDHKP